MSNTPETDAAVIASNGQWSFVLKETCQRLERERDEAMQALSGRTVSCAACNHAAIERDEAREKAERYRLEANAMMLQRDEAQKHLQDIKEYGTEEINAAVELRQKLAAALLERDEARLLAIWAADRLSAHLDPVKYHGTASRLRTLCHRHPWLNCPEDYHEK